MRKIIYRYFIGRSKYQKFFLWLYRFSLRGMNYSASPDFQHSGELFVLQYVKSKTTDPIIFDVGANVGDYAIKLSDLFNGKIYSFEPSPPVFQKLVDNVRGIKNISCFNIGLSDVQKEVKLYSSKNNSSLSSVYKRNLQHVGVTLDSEESISLNTIDQFCAENKIDQIDFMKLDVEGHELFAMKGALNMIKANKIRFIQFEFGGTDIDSRTFFRDFWYLLKDNYIIYRIVKDGLVSIDSYSEELELFTAVNYFVELKST